MSLGVFISVARQTRYRRGLILSSAYRHQRHSRVTKFVRFSCSEKLNYEHHTILIARTLYYHFEQHLWSLLKCRVVSQTIIVQVATRNIHTYLHLYVYIIIYNVWMVCAQKRALLTSKLDDLTSFRRRRSPIVFLEASHSAVLALILTNADVYIYTVNAERRLQYLVFDDTRSEMEFLGVKFAPFRVPIERRLQTLAAAAWIFTLGFGGPISCLVTIYLLLFTEWLRYLIIIYFVWVYYDRDTCRRGGRGKAWTSWMRNSSWWRYYCNYFPIKLVKTVDLDPSRSYLFCSFPHGILSSGAFGAFATNYLGFEKLFPGLESRMLTLDMHFHIPLFREFSFSFGACSASAESLHYLLSDRKTSLNNVNECSEEVEEKTGGKAVVLVIGGAAESLKCKPGRYEIVLRRRKGFVRIALQHGTPLVPVISFGETDLYDQIVSSEGSLLNKLQEFIRKVTGVAPVLPVGRGFFQYTFGMVPKRKPVTVVVGSPMELPKIPNPTAEQIDEYHAKFKENLINFFETEKYKYLRYPSGISLTIT